MMVLAIVHYQGHANKVVEKKAGPRDQEAGHSATKDLEGLDVSE